MIDLYDNIIPPEYVLTKANDDRIGIINCTEKRHTKKFNEYDEISFTTYLYIDNQKNEIYDKIAELQYVELPDIGRFIINRIEIDSSGSDFESKQCTALSIEVTLAQKYLEHFVINMGTTESIDGVCLYNLSNPEKSLLHLVLEKCPDWTIGHVDTELMTVERCFEVDRQDVYSFLVNDISEKFECIFLFDTIHRRINVYTEEHVGSDTNIYVSYNNLLKSTNISSNIDDIKTCLTVTGSDDLSIREVNMGYDRIYMLDYFNSPEYMSQGLYDAYNTWVTKWNANVDNYESLVTQYQAYYDDIYYLQSEKMPSDPESTDWAQYGLNPLNEKKDSYEQQLAVLIKQGCGASDNKDYNTLYLPCYNAIQSITSQIAVVQSQIDDLKSKQTAIGNQMDAIISSVSMQNNFTSEQLKELSKFIREDELSSDNFVVTDTMTDSERMDMLHEMLDYGQKELAKVAQPTLTFSMDMANIYAIPEFNILSNTFEVGNYISVAIRDDYMVKAKILTIDLNYYDPDDFSVTFGNLMRRKDTGVLADITNALQLAQSAATSVSMNSSNWDKANQEADNINQMLSEGLLNAGNSLRTSKSDVTIDDRGILVSNIPESQYPNDRIFIGNSQILFSDDNLKTIKTALGRCQYTKEGVQYNDFGLLASFVIAGFIGGSTIEGNNIIANTIKGNSIVGNNIDGNTITGGTITGSYFNNGNGTFVVDENGNLTANNANITGIVKANTGYIGGPNGFTIQSGKLYSGSKSSFSSANSGVYIGTDGISLGANNPFFVDDNGNFVAKSGTIGGIRINANSLASSNGNFSINDSGYALFKDLTVSGVRPGSSFGGINYDSYGTYGNFNNGFLAGNSFGVNGGALNDFQTLVVDSIHARQVLADYITAGEVSANYATIGSLNAVSARIDNLSATYATIDSVAANYATISSLNAANARIDNLSSASINVNRLTAGSVNGHSVSWRLIAFISQVHIDTEDVTIGGRTFKTITDYTVSGKYLYVMAEESDQ